MYDGIALIYYISIRKRNKTNTNLAIHFPKYFCCAYTTTFPFPKQNNPFQKCKAKPK